MSVWAARRSAVSIRGLNALRPSLAAGLPIGKSQFNHTIPQLPRANGILEFLRRLSFIGISKCNANSDVDKIAYNHPDEIGTL